MLFNIDAVNVARRYRRPAEMVRRVLAATLLGALTLAPILASRATAQASESAPLELVMFAEAGCVWCAQWDAEIGVIYDKTAEGATAPLRRVDMHAPTPVDIDLTRPVLYSPTFVLTRGGREQSRIEGHPGEMWFFPFLERMIAAAQEVGEEP